jgi:hypothetical protein
VRFYGVWAPHHRWRSRVVIETPKTKRSASSAKGQTAPPPPPAPSCVASTCELRRASSEPQVPSAAALPQPHAASHSVCRRERRTTLHPAIALGLGHAVPEGLRHRPLVCSTCGGQMRFVEVIEDVARGAQRAPPPKPPCGASAAVEHGHRIGLIEADRPWRLNPLPDRGSGVDRCASNSVRMAPGRRSRTL